MKLVRLDDGQVIAEEVMQARSFFKKTFGLTVGPRLDQGQCLAIKGCRSIHTIGMRYSIDAVLIDQGGRVVKIYKGLKPFRVTGFLPTADQVLEFRAGVLQSKGLLAGQVLVLK